VAKDKTTSEDAQHLSPDQMKDWLLQEIRDVSKASELRITDALSFVTAYALGTLTPEQAEERLLQYDRRWGDALPGAHAFASSTDNDIVEAIDSALEERDLAKRRTSWVSTPHKGAQRGG